MGNKNKSNIVPKVEEPTNKGQKPVDLEIHLSDIFRNGNSVTIDLQEKGILPHSSTKEQDPLSKRDLKLFKRGRNSNTPKEESLLKTAINELRESEKDFYNRFGFSFKKVDGIWIQDTVEVIGNLSATIGTIIMGNVTLDNATLPSYMTEFGNAYDKLHGVKRVTLTGKIY